MVITPVDPPHWIYVARAGDERGTSSIYRTPSGRPHTTIENTYFPSRKFGEVRLRATLLANSRGEAYSQG